MQMENAKPEDDDETVDFEVVRNVGDFEEAEEEEMAEEDKEMAQAKFNE